MQCEGELRPAEVVVVQAKRIHLEVDPAGNVVKDKENTSTKGVQSYFCQTEDASVSKSANHQTGVRTFAKFPLPGLLMMSLQGCP